MPRKRTKYLPMTGEHATISKVESGSLKGLVSRATKHKISKRDFRLYSTSMTLANLLFPENFPKQVASKRTKFKRRWWIFSRRKYSRATSYAEYADLDEASKEGIHGFYLDSSGATMGTARAHRYHQGRVNTEANKKARELERAGIRVNTIEANVGFSKKTNEPIFFEIGVVDCPQLRQYIHRMPEGTKSEKLKKRQALELFGALQRTKPGRARMLVHHPEGLRSEGLR